LRQVEFTDVVTLLLVESLDGRQVSNAGVMCAKSGAVSEDFGKYGNALIQPTRKHAHSIKEREVGVARLVAKEELSLLKLGINEGVNELKAVVHIGLNDFLALSDFLVIVLDRHGGVDGLDNLVG